MSATPPRLSFVNDGPWPAELFAALGSIVATSPQAANLFGLLVERKWRGKLPDDQIDAVVLVLAEEAKQNEASR